MAPPTMSSKNEHYNKSAQDDSNYNDAVESRAKNEARKDMQNVTNFVNEELANREVNAASLTRSLRFLQEAARTHCQTSIANTASSAPLNKQDVEFLMSQMQITKGEAERSLRENGNDVIAALNHLVEK
ncbi:hypothetical protein BX666DRAFT_1935584 [Dichotomocladium elegans]|nr:hypothetical protein BX666DRAFT_1935584 [Dichotomocladium elegans]